ncbi:cytochrome PufQ [Roseisalinus antarcticus]|uniref:PufQ cytochrome subunit n=1 Tax=Roseisalinus antarcticus TaxID=254357 RepID=A0A1Y5S4M2_9RHOB|nr:cytochrome PufQ [Roseisalinus antarcticus]SLN31568.1 PufQ cytochrome subunit [Roseisalinus antarcticus]
MTDFTTDAPVVRQRSTNAPRREYYAYFAVIFLATLPLALLTWALTALRHGHLPEKGPIKRAWSQARIITPHIFSA